MENGIKTNFETTRMDAALHAYDIKWLNAHFRCHLNQAATCHLQPQFGVYPSRNLNLRSHFPVGLVFRPSIHSVGITNSF